MPVQPSVVLTERFTRAVDYARVEHAAQVRKGSRFGAHQICRFRTRTRDQAGPKCDLPFASTDCARNESQPTRPGLT